MTWQAGRRRPWHCLLPVLARKLSAWDSRTSKHRNAVSGGLLVSHHLPSRWPRCSFHARARLQGLFERAIHDYTRAVQLHPGHCRAYYNRAFCHDRLDHVEQVGGGQVEQVGGGGARGTGGRGASGIGGGGHVEQVGGGARATGGRGQSGRHRVWRAECGGGEGRER